MANYLRGHFNFELNDVTYVEALHPVNVPYYQELTW